MLNIEKISDEIESLVKDWEPVLSSLPPDVISQRRNSQDRTIRQITGHLTDSASNNIHRIVHLHYQPVPFEFPNYATFGNNDRWIAIQNYQAENWTNLVQLWKYSLLHVAHVIRNIDKNKLENEWIAGPGRKMTLEKMVGEFTPHLLLHLAEINELINKK